MSDPLSPLLMIYTSDADVRIPWAKLYYCHVEPSGLGAVVIFLVSDAYIVCTHIKTGRGEMTDADCGGTFQKD